MLFVSVEDFLAKADATARICREEEKALAVRMAEGDEEAREMLIRSQFPLVASFLKRESREFRNLYTVYVCIAAVEKGVDHFNFQQDREPFARYMGRSLRQCITRCIAERF